jgi:SAM-dependent methyltransferase
MTTKWTADTLLEMVRGFQAACVITAGADLDLFTVLAPAPLTADELAARTASDPRALLVLLDALTALELLTTRGGRYEVPAQVAQLLTADSPVNVLAGIRHQANCLRRWDQLARVVQTGRPARREPSVRGEAGDCESFIGAMNSFSGPMLVPTVERLSPLRFQRLLDIGGASGTWTIAFLRAVPEATAVLFDQPQVLPLARDRLARAGLADRVSLVAGDFDKDELPGGADFAWLSAIVHQNSRAQNRVLYRKIFSALTADGTLVIRDVVMDATKTRPVAGAVFAINMLVGTAGGGTFSFDEFQEDLTSAGFAQIELVHQGDAMDSLIRARKR